MVPRPTRRRCATGTPHGSIQPDLPREEPANYANTPRAPPREMSNLPLPIGYPDRDRAKLRQISKLPSPTTYQEHYQLYGHVQNLPIYDGTGCMPDSVGRWVFDGSRVRKLQLDELAKGKGVPGEWRDKSLELPYKAVVGATAVHIWTVVCDAVAGWLIPTPKDRISLLF
ncbi:unknown protein (Partial), partial [Seminavis robusta]|eukprot:Sro1394_g269000.1 n/a (169) ;mRNA; f:29669-30177